MQSALRRNFMKAFVLFLGGAAVSAPPSAADQDGGRIAPGTGAGPTPPDRAGPLISPADFGASEDARDNTAAITDAFRFVAGSWNPDKQDFDRVLDFGGRRYRIAGSLDFTGLRQPGIVVRNGQIHASGAGNVAVDATGTIGPTFVDLGIDGDADDPPAVGLLLAREDTGAITHGARLHRVTIEGTFTKSAMVNFASEVSRHSDCTFSNNHPGDRAYAYVGVGDSRMLDDHVGGLESAHRRLAAGRHSNILHDLGQINIKRPAKSSLEPIDISRTRPALVQLVPEQLQRSHIRNGTEVYFHNIEGMEELNGDTYTVANLDARAGAFELEGLDARTFGRYEGGRVWMKSGPAVLLGAVSGVHAPQGYILTYGAPSVRMAATAGQFRDIELCFQHEAHPATVVEWITKPDGATLVSGFVLKLMSMPGKPGGHSIMRAVGEGSIHIDDAEIAVRRLSGPPPHGLFWPPARFRISDARIHIPFRGMLGDPGAYKGFNGQVFALDDNRTWQIGGPVLHSDAPEQVAAEALSLADGPDPGPTVDLTRRRQGGEADGDALGLLRFNGGDRTFASLAGRIADAGAGREAGALDAVVERDGAPEVALRIEGPAGAGSTALALLVDEGGRLALKQVTLGPPDSAGPGYRTLRVGNPDR